MLSCCLCLHHVEGPIDGEASWEFEHGGRMAEDAAGSAIAEVGSERRCGS